MLFQVSPASCWENNKRKKEIVFVLFALCWVTYKKGQGIWTTLLRQHSRGSDAGCCCWCQLLQLYIVFTTSSTARGHITIILLLLADGMTAGFCMCGRLHVSESDLHACPGIAIGTC